MVDFTTTDSVLAETFKTKKSLPDITLAPLKEKDDKEKVSLAPEIPSLNFDPSIPQNVQDSARQSQQLSSLSRNAQRSRQNELGFLLEDAQDTINDAEDKIERSNNNPFGEILGMFDDDYDVSLQQKRMSQASRSVQTKIATNKIKNASEELDAADAGAEYTAFLNSEKLKQQKFARTSAEALAITQSNSAKKSFGEFEFSKLTVAEMTTMKKTRNFNEVATEQRIDSYFAKRNKAIRLADTAAVALKQSKLDYSQDLEKDILADFPVQYLRDQLQRSVDGNEPVVTLGKNFKLAPSKVQAAISLKDKTGDEFRNSEAQRAVSGAKNYGAFNEVNRDMAVLSTDYMGGPNNIPLEKLNMTSINDDVLAQIDVSRMHPSLQSSYISLLAFTNNLNSKNTGVTEQDIATQKAMMKEFQDKAAVIKKNAIDSQPTKALKASQTEWYSNGGKMQSGINSAAVVAANVSTMPDFGGDSALEGAWTAFGTNIVEELSGSSVDFTTAEGEIDQSAFLESLLAKTVGGKIPDQDKIIKAMNQPNAKGQTPLTVYTGIKAQETLVQAMKQLAEKDVNVKQQLFDGNGQPGAWAKSPLELAKILSDLSFAGQQADNSLANNYLNFALQDEMNEVMKNGAASWNTQGNMERGSFMVNLFKNKQPFAMVDRVLGNTWAVHVGPAWETTVKNAQDVVAKAKMEEERSSFQRMQGL